MPETRHWRIAHAVLAVVVSLSGAVSAQAPVQPAPQPMPVQPPPAPRATPARTPVAAPASQTPPSPAPVSMPAPQAPAAVAPPQPPLGSLETPKADVVPPPDSAGLAARAADRIKALQRETEQLAAQSKSMLAQLRQLELTRALRTEELSTVNVRLAAITAKLDASKTRVASLEAQRVSRTPALEERMEALYKRGKAGYVKLLVSSSDGRDLARASRGVVALARLEELRIAEHRRLLAEETAARDQMASEQRQVMRLRVEAENLQSAASRAVAERARMLDDIDRRRELAAQYVGELEQARQRLQTTISGLSGSPMVDLPLRPFQGTLPWPVDGPLISRFGRIATGSFGTAIKSNGIEIGAEPGTPVRAVHGGTIAYSAPFTGFGVLVIIDHGDNALTVYGHLAGTALRPGGTVTRGQILGATGVNTEGKPATYFEVRVDGRPANPVQWLTPSP